MIIILILFCFTSLWAQKEHQTFNNPVLAGFYPDPSICKVGNDYYLVNSTFAYYPGIPIFHSKDMVNWNQIGHVLDRPEQLKLDGMGVSRGIFAPAITYHKGTYFLVCTLVDGKGNFVVTAKDPTGPWSNPVWIPEINGIDPSLYFDENDKAYIVYNSIPPNNESLYDGHRTIRMYRFDAENLKVTGKEKILVNGGTNISKEPVWIEAPHIFKKEGFYYLIAAEGGTSYNHSEVVFRSKNVDGPYTSFDGNPILTQRHLDPNRPYPITSTGHADFVQPQTGDWWAVFLGCRPYKPYNKNYFNTGRETFLAPVTWANDWPVINANHKEVQYQYPLPVASTHPIKNNPPHSGNFSFTDEFDSEKLNDNWIFLRTPYDQWYDLSAKKGSLKMKVRPETCSEKVNPSFIAHRQQHAHGNVSTMLSFSAQSENEKAGLVVFQNETHFYFLSKSIQNEKPVIQLYKSLDDTNEQNDGMELLAAQNLNDDTKEKISLKIEANGNTYAFYYATKKDDWILLEDKVDATFLSTEVAGGFVGCTYGMYATSLGNRSQNAAIFDWFRYEGNDKVYINK